MDIGDGVWRRGVDIGDGVWRRGVDIGDGAGCGYWRRGVEMGCGYWRRGVDMHMRWHLHYTADRQRSHLSVSSRSHARSAHRPIKAVPVLGAEPVERCEHHVVVKREVLVVSGAEGGRI